MRPAHCFSALLLSLLASLSNTLADATDDALNQFYTENFMDRLTSDVPGAVNENPPSPRKEEKRSKANKPHKDIETPKRTGISDHISKTANGFFNYRSSATVTSKAQTYFLTTIAGKDQNKIAFIQKEFVHNSGENRFDARFSRYGYSNHDSSDSFAGFLIVLWEIMNSQDASAHPSGIRQARLKIYELLLNKFGSKTITDETKQYYSEYFKLLAVVFSDWWKEEVSKRDAAEIQKVQYFAYQCGRKLRIDFKRLRLTDAGFQKI
jgi:hypothetical protein